MPLPPLGLLYWSYLKTYQIPIQSPRLRHAQRLIVMIMVHLQRACTDVVVHKRRRTYQLACLKAM